MKKILLIVPLVAGSYALKAQTLVKPLDSTLLKSPELFKQLKPNDSPLMKQYFNLPPLQNAPLLASIQPIKILPFASRMPILKVHSDDKMPIAKMSSDDHMPVLVVKPVDPLKPVNP
ncbi:MAG: hypothetical protein JSU01_20450 [Bacteroidetes bacterium]|nr:hypothetical protein [Bacteroidota bacterium]